MRRTNPYTKGRLGALRRWLPILVLPTVLIVGCSDDDHGRPVPTATATRTPARTATPTSTPTIGALNAACQKLSGCDQCFINERGVCISTEACAAHLTTDAAHCINAVTDCSQGALGDCMAPGCDGGDSTGECE
jgi:hypothetical protein